MRFWTWKPIGMVCAIISATYLAILGFQGRLPGFMGALGWLLVAVAVSLDLMVAEVEYRKRKARMAFEAALSAHFDRQQECCCDSDCSQCPDKHDGEKEE